MKASDAPRVAALVEALDGIDAVKAAAAKSYKTKTVLELSVTTDISEDGSSGAASLYLPLDFGEFMIPYCEAAIRKELERLGVTL